MPTPYPEPKAVYVEVAPLARHAAVVDHFYILRNDGSLSGGGRQRFASPFSEIRYTTFATGGVAAPSWRGFSSGPIRSGVPRRRPMVGCVAGLRFDRVVIGLAVPPFAATVAIDLNAELDPILRALDATADTIVRKLRQLAAPTDDLPKSAGYSASRLANTVGVSDRTLRRRLMTATNVSPKTWPVLHRFRTVAHEIAIGDASLAELAQDHGYSDQAHLTSDFSRRTGLTPRQFRAQAATGLGADPGRFFKDDAHLKRLRLLVTPNAERCSHDLHTERPWLS